MTLKTKLLATAVGAASLFAATGAFAGNLPAALQQPGLTAGIATGAPLPVGLFEVAIFDYGVRSGGTGTSAGYPGGTDITVGVPINLIWSTPYEFLGGRAFFQFANAEANVGIGSRGATLAYLSGVYINVLGAGMGWNLGGGFSATIEEEVYLPVSSGVGPENFATFSQEAAIAYKNDGWLVNLHGAYGTGRNGTPNMTRQLGPGGPYLGNNVGSAWLNWDLTVAKTFGKWEFGAFAFGTSDLSTVYPNYAKYSETALGVLAGYNFGPVIAQVKLSTDVAVSNSFGYDTRGWLTLVVPLWVPEAPKAVSAKY